MEKRYQSLKKALSHLLLPSTLCKLPSSSSSIPYQVLDPSLVGITRTRILDDLDRRLLLHAPHLHGDKKRGHKGKTRLPFNNAYGFSSSSSDVFSSGEEKLPRSFSSDSSELYYSSVRSKNGFTKPRRTKSRGGRSGSLDDDGGRCVAVVKKSRDPYEDFRSSMLEMMVERQMFGAEELEGLLRRYLSLNDSRHHAVIVKVYCEIREALSGGQSCC